jgi:hypothetical protein
MEKKLTKASWNQTETREENEIEWRFYCPIILLRRIHQATHHLSHHRLRLRSPAHLRKFPSLLQLYFRLQSVPGLNEELNRMRNADALTFFIFHPKPLEETPGCRLERPEDVPVQRLQFVGPARRNKVEDDSKLSGTTLDGR